MKDHTRTALWLLAVLVLLSAAFSWLSTGLSNRWARSRHKVWRELLAHAHRQLAVQALVLSGLLVVEFALEMHDWSARLNLALVATLVISMLMLVHLALVLRTRSDEWTTWEELPASEVRLTYAAHASRGRRWCPNAETRRVQRAHFFHAIREYFIEQHELPVDYPFAQYITQCMGETLKAASTLGSLIWILLAIVGLFVLAVRASSGLSAISSLECAYWMLFSLAMVLACVQFYMTRKTLGIQQRLALVGFPSSLDLDSIDIIPIEQEIRNPSSPNWTPAMLQARQTVDPYAEFTNPLLLNDAQFSVGISDEFKGPQNSLQLTRTGGRSRSVSFTAATFRVMTLLGYQPSLDPFDMMFPFRSVQIPVRCFRISLLFQCLYIAIVLVLFIPEVACTNFYSVRYSLMMLLLYLAPTCYFMAFYAPSTLANLSLVRYVGPHCQERVMHSILHNRDQR